MSGYQVANLCLGILIAVFGAAIFDSGQNKAWGAVVFFVIVLIVLFIALARRPPGRTS